MSKLRDLIIPSVDEWHVFVIGFCEILCPIPTRRIMSNELSQTLADEYHYYMLGRALAILTWIAIALLIKEVIL